MPPPKCSANSPTLSWRGQPTRSSRCRGPAPEPGGGSSRNRARGRTALAFAIADGLFSRGKSGKRSREGAARAWRAPAHGQVAAEPSRALAGDRPPEASTPIGTRRSRIAAPEWLEDMRLIHERYPSPRIAHLYMGANVGAVSRPANYQRYFPGLRELHRVGEQVDDDLSDLPWVGVEGDGIQQGRNPDAQPLPLCEGPHEFEALLDDIGEVHGLGPNDVLGGLEARESEKLLDEAE